MSYVTVLSNSLLLRIEIPNVFYIVTLTSEERSYLKKLVRTGKNAAYCSIKLELMDKKVLEFYPCFFGSKSPVNPNLFLILTLWESMEGITSRTGSVAKT